MKKKVLILHGPNLNLLGERTPTVYGTLTLAQINSKLRHSAKELGLSVKIFQSNSEGKLIDLLQKHRQWADGVVINPAAYTHYSYALRDAIEGISVPTVEVHLSKISTREKFRRVSVVAAVCAHSVEGLGWKSYLEGMHFLKRKWMAPQDRSC